MKIDDSTLIRFINNDLSFKDFINSSVINIDITESKINPRLFDFKDFKFKTNQFLKRIVSLISLHWF